jgi:hypothetical protein
MQKIKRRCEKFVLREGVGKYHNLFYKETLRFCIKNRDVILWLLKINLSFFGAGTVEGDDVATQDVTRDVRICFNNTFHCHLSSLAASYKSLFPMTCSEAERNSSHRACTRRTASLYPSKIQTLHALPKPPGTVDTNWHKPSSPCNDHPHLPDGADVRPPKFADPLKFHPINWVFRDLRRSEAVVVGTANPWPHIAGRREDGV